MTLTTLTIFDIPISVESKTILLERVVGYLEKKEVKQAFLIVTPNPEQLMRAGTDQRFASILSHADLGLPDGTGVSWALQRLYGKHVDRLSGIDFCVAFLQSLPSKTNCFLIGGNNDILTTVSSELKERFSSLNFSVEDPGKLTVEKFRLSFSGNASQRFLHTGQDMSTKEASVTYQNYISRLAQQLKKSAPCVVFVGLGAPKQEYLMDDVAEELGSIRLTKPVVLMAVGGTFDILAGKTPRAPAWIRSLGIEWLWRLILEPWRIGRQQALIGFVRKVWSHPGRRIRY